MEFKCIMIQHGLNVTSHGSLTPCCVSDSGFIQLDKDSDIVASFRSEKWQKLYENYDNGIVNDICKFCFIRDTAEINADLKTPRIRWNEGHQEYYDSHLKEQQRGIKNKSIIRLFFSFGNTCNQMCIMCNSKYSSKWLVQDTILMQDLNKKQLDDINRYDMTLKNQTISDERIEQVLSLLDEHIQSISILGGEPLLDKRLGYFIERILEKNPDCKINITTNLTPLTEEIVGTFNKIKRLSLSLSIDGINETYRWIRDYDFDSLSEKLDLLFKNISSDHTVVINFTIMKYNVDKIKETYEFIDSVSRKYGKDLMFQIEGVVSKPIYLHLRYADPEKILAGIEQIKIIQEAQSSEPNRKKHRFSRIHPIDNMINYLKNNLENPPTDEEREQERLFEERLIKIRGWNLND
jgi:molybdenum cofactor biosynthesis enzyme MoaA